MHDDASGELSVDTGAPVERVRIHGRLGPFMLVRHPNLSAFAPWRSR
jgi:hypothetical protein